MAHWDNLHLYRGVSSSNMSDPDGPVHADPTFRSYDRASAAAYASHRKGYPQRLFDHILKQHVDSGGELGTLVDVGCGPGPATRQLAPHFEEVYGLDPGESMLGAARELGGTTKAGGKIVYEISSAEEIDVALERLGAPDGSVDMITVATAAHWFDMPRFYAAAAKMLKPSGTLAMWCTGWWHVDKRRTPNAEKVSAVMEDYLLERLRAWAMPGNLICCGLYKDLELPWTTAVGEDWDKERFSRRTWNEGGRIEEDEIGEVGDGFLLRINVTWEEARAMLGTQSMVNRWREAHKDALQRGEMKDTIDEFLEAMRAAMQEGGTGESPLVIEGGASIGLLMLQKTLG